MIEAFDTVQGIEASRTTAVGSADMKHVEDAETAPVGAHMTCMETLGCWRYRFRDRYRDHH